MITPNFEQLQLQLAGDSPPSESPQIEVNSSREPVNPSRELGNSSRELGALA